MGSPMNAHAPLRALRAAAFSAVCVLLAALAHLVAGGAAPTTGTLGLGAGAVFVLALLLGGAERGQPVLTVALGATQLGLHELFGTQTDYLPAHHGGGGLSVSAGMLLAHLGATLVTGWWLARGENTLWSLLRRLFLRLALFVLPGLPVTRQAPILPLPVPARPSELRHIVSRRGPPLPA
ncbi:hypothetical protein GCM10022248_59740 [Nonomuraea soli]